MEGIILILLIICYSLYRRYKQAEETSNYWFNKYNKSQKDNFELRRNQKK